MTLTFPGTRANIPLRSRRHRRHSVALIAGRKGRLLIDCGEDWLGGINRLRPSAILVTHAHPDHAGGLRHGARCPVYATAAAWEDMDRWPIAVRHVLPLRHPIAIAGFAVEAWPVHHSLIAPAVGFRISSTGACLFYVPDVAGIREPRRALDGVDLYAGDGAVLERSLVRDRAGTPTGHASVPAQLDWCRKAGIGRAVFTHCGSAIVRSDTRVVDAAVRELGRRRGVDARLAYDGLTLDVRRERSRLIAAGSGPSARPAPGRGRASRDPAAPASRRGAARAPRRARTA